MKTAFELRLQAYLDGELTPDEARAVEAALSQDQTWQPLHAELKHTKALLAGNELPRQTPVTSDFFWSQVERQINGPVAARSATPAPFWLVRWWKLLAPACALAVFAGVALNLSQREPQSPGVAALSGMESEAAGPDTSVITFRSDLEGVSVVWVNTE